MFGCQGISFKYKFSIARLIYINQSKVIVRREDVTSKKISDDIKSKTINGESSLRGRGLPPSDIITTKITNLLNAKGLDAKGFYCVTFVGYSSLGYKRHDLLKATLEYNIHQCLNEHRDKKIVIVCGGTCDGIGIVYKIVSANTLFRNAIVCIGIVSNEASFFNENELALDKEQIIFVPDEKKEWQAKSPAGYPYMLYPAHKYGGGIIALGGGGYDELKTARQYGIKTTVFLFEPNQFALQKN